MKSMGPLLKRVALQAINICFTMPDTFDSKNVALALQHLVDQPRIPLLLMVTVCPNQSNKLFGTKLFASDDPHCCSV